MANKIDKGKVVLYPSHYDNKLLHDAALKHRHRAELAATLGDHDRAVEAMQISVWLCELEKLRLMQREGKANGKQD